MSAEGIGYLAYAVSAGVFWVYVIWMLAQKKRAAASQIADSNRPEGKL